MGVTDPTQTVSRSPAPGPPLWQRRPLGAERGILAVTGLEGRGGVLYGMDSPASFRTVGDAAGVATRILSLGEPLSEVWRFALAQLLDDYTSVFQHCGVAAAARMWSEAPPPAGDARVDAALAAMAEHLGRRDGWRVPTWARDPSREALPWWFVTELRGLHPQALVESPSSFRRRGIFITRGALERV